MQSSKFYKDSNQNRKYRYRHPFNTFHFLAVLGFILIVFLVVIRIDKALPAGLKISEEAENPNRFIAERAYNFLDKLTKIGPRIVGSYANEVAAVKLLKDEIGSIINSAHPNHIIELDVQQASGDFSIDFIDGMNNVYRNVQNVVVRMGSKINSSHSLLLNAHFDSAADSPGASDVGAGCAVLMEILRVLSKSPEILRHNIIFLFNGAEETILQGSHGFITQHKWAKEVAAFINVEACGADGREHLLQVSKPWLLDIYVDEIAHPFATTGSQEVFDRKLFPGDTDYRIFRDYGNVSGMDFVWLRNGYVYHTNFDTIDHISLGSLQRTGDNILTLVKAIVRSHQLGKTEEYEDEKFVYFDVLGVFILRWSTTAASFINIAAVIFSCYTINGNMRNAKGDDDISRNQFYKKLNACMSAMLGLWILSVVTAILIAFCLTSLNKAMSWYSRPSWIIFLYIIPTLFICMTGLVIHSRRYLQDLTLVPSVQFQFYYDACQLIWTVLLVLGMLVQVHSISSVALIWVIFASLGNFLKTIIFGKKRDLNWLLFYVGITGVPLIQTGYWTVVILYIFLPIAGRFGAATPSEVVIAAIVSILFTLILSFIVPLILLIRNTKKIISLLLALFVCSLIVLFLTPLGFPYSGEVTHMAPQRFIISHTKRTFHDTSGSIAKEQTGYWFINIDLNSPQSVENYVPEVAFAESTDEDCKNYLYCGLPYPLPGISGYWKNHWLPGPSPEVMGPSMNIIRKQPTDNGIRVSIEINGASRHIVVMVSPVIGVELTSFNLESKPLAGPKWKGRNTYFILYGRGLGDDPFELSMDFTTRQEHSGPIMDLAVTSQYLFEPEKSSKQFEDFIAKFPPWAAVNYITSTYESWII